MDVSFEVIRGTGSSGKSKLKAYFLVRMQKKDIHIPLELGPLSFLDAGLYIPISYLSIIFLADQLNNEAMTVSERRYLIKNANAFCSDQIVGVYSTESIGVCTFVCKHQIFDHTPISQ